MKRGIPLISLVLALTMVLSIGLILWSPPEKGYLGRIFALVLTNVLVGIPALIYIFSSSKTFYHREYWRFCLPLALPFIFYNLSDLLLGQSDRVMLQQMMSRAAVGEYSLALKFGGIMFTIFGALNSTWCPFFFDYMKDGNRDSFQQCLQFHVLHLPLCCRVRRRRIDEGHDDHCTACHLHAGINILLGRDDIACR